MLRLKVIRTTPREHINERDQQGRTAISWACAKNDLQKIEKLLKMGADPNIADSTGRTSLYHLAHYSSSIDERCLDERCLDELLDHGINVNFRNRRGRTPLHDFVFNPLCTASCIEKFYLEGADLNAQDDYGWTPVIWAGRYGDIELIEKLIQCGAYLEIQSSLGITLLTYALIRHQFGAFKYLLELGCDHTIRTRSNSTLLHICARDGDVDMLHYLAQRDLEGIDPDDTDEDGLTALERAERRDGVYEWIDFINHEAPPDAEPQVWFEAFLALNEKLKTMQAKVR